MGSGGADISRHTNKKPRRGALQGFYRNWCASAFCRVGSDALHSNPQYANGFPKVDQEAIDAASGFRDSMLAQSGGRVAL